MNAKLSAKPVTWLSDGRGWTTLDVAAVEVLE